MEKSRQGPARTVKQQWRKILSEITTPIRHDPLVYDHQITNSVQ